MGRNKTRLESWCNLSRSLSADVLQNCRRAGVAGTTDIGTIARTDTGKIATGATVGTGTLGGTAAGMSGSGTIDGVGRGIIIDR